MLVGPEQKEGKESKKKKEVATLENASAAFDSYEHQALFASIKVNISTRMTPVHFKFGLQVRNGEFSMQVESGPSYPFIVITNESQWCEAAGKLLHADAFADNAVSLLDISSIIHAKLYTVLARDHLGSVRQHTSKSLLAINVAELCCADSTDSILRVPLFPSEVLQ